jgi:hypothetical protein
MAWFGGRAARRARSASCGFCGKPTMETDRSGRPAHRACVARVLAMVTEESRPSRDPHDLARRIATQRQLPAGVDGFRLGGRGELADRLAAAAELGVSVRDLPTGAVAELRALVDQELVVGRSR